jgi:exosome complex component RRP41
MALNVQSREYVSPEGLRLDGRRPHEVRRMDCKLGMFSRVDGSAYLEQGNTKVIASVYGPREMKRRADAIHDRADVKCEFSRATFSTSERKYQSKNNRQSKEIQVLLKQTFEQAILTELFPRSQIHIFVQVLQSDGGEVCAAINAATLALINAGIPMHGFLCACSSGYVDGIPIVDMNYLEKAGAGPELVVAAYPDSDRVIVTQLDNKLPLDQFEKVLKLAMQGCTQMYKVLKDKVKGHVMSLKS